MNKEKSKKSNKKVFIIIAAIIIAVSIGALVFFLLLPKYDIVINGANVSNSVNNNGIKEISASLSVDCNSKEENGSYVCEELKISGTYSGDGTVELKDDNSLNFNTNENSISFNGKKISYKKVVVREEKIASTDNNYELVMKDKDGKEVVNYKLTITTNLTSEDDASINAEPNKEAIAAALKTIDSIKESCILNEDNDPNNEIGKDGQYYIKVSYIDNRVDLKYYGDLDDNFNFVASPNSCAESGSDAGGTIEVFRSVEDAKKRKEYLDGFTGVLSAGKSKLINTTLVRVSPNLKSSEQNDLLEKIYQALSK
ncbi:hypothetical protein IKG13_02285 [Candidatus Saccharibacteria bacterium]|nr:hypothetical protein [Candidatus Saccharibacteria bacterium]